MKFAGFEKGDMTRSSSSTAALAAGAERMTAKPVGRDRRSSDWRRTWEGTMTACIVGWAHTVFGKLAAETVESLIVRVANEALAHAGIGPADVDEILLGHFNAGFSPQDFTASIVLQASDAGDLEHRK